MDFSNIQNKQNLRLGLEMYSSETRSTYTMTNGGGSDWYWDIDRFLLGASSQGPDGQEYLDSKTSGRRIELVVSGLARELREIRKTKGASRVAFVENNAGGPIGMIAFASSLISTTDFDAIFVRPRRNVLASALKGRPFSFGERVVLLSDVATTGTSLMKAVNVLREAGAEVVSSLVVLDREEGARDVLSANGVELNSLWSAQDRARVHDAHLAA